MRTAILAAALLGLLAASALAAPAPSVTDVINALTLKPGGIARGSRPVVAPQSGAAAAPVVAGSGAIDLNVEFASGKAALTPEARKTLDVLGQALVSPQLANAKVRIEGHTDTVGSRETNLALSWQRAVAAVTYLQETFHIAPGRLEPLGRGEDDLLVPTGPGVDEPRNRRVHVVNIGG